MNPDVSIIREISDALLRRPVAVSMCYAALVVGGLWALGRLPLDLAPFVEFPALSVQTAWPGVSAETVEMMLTAPIEEAGNTVFGVRGTNSVSSEGLSRVSFEFQQETRMNFARLELNEKLAALLRTLPAGVGQPVIEPYIPEDFQDLYGFMTYSLVGNRPASVLRKLCKEEIAPRLLSIRGVADVVVYGGEEEEIHIDLNASKMEALGLDVEAATSGLGVLEFSAPVGEFTHGSRRHVVSVRNSGLTLADIGRIPIARNANGSPIRIMDVGIVRMATADPTSFSRINGRPCVTLAIDKDPSVNTLRLSEAVAARAAELCASLPAGVELVLESDKSADMRAELDTLSRDIALSLLCIFVVLFLFLGNLKAPIIVLSSIFFSLAGSFLVFWILGMGLHLLSLAGLVLGFGRLVDDSIVVLENIQRRSHGTMTRNRITSAVGEIALPVVASTAATVGALLPTCFLPDDLKPYFIEFSLATGISLFMSLIVSFTLIPVVAARWGGASVMPGVCARAGAWGIRMYARLLHRALHRRWVVLLLVLWLLGVPVWLLPESISAKTLSASAYNAVFGSSWYRTVRPYVNHLLGGTSHLFFTKVEKGEVWASGRETYVIVRISFPQTIDLSRCDEIARSVEAEALGFGNGIGKVACRVEPDCAFIRISVADSLSNTGVPYLLRDRLTMLAARTGGASIGVWGFGPGYSTGGEGAPSFAMRVLGYNYGQVKEIAQRFREQLEVNTRIAEVDIDRSPYGERGIATELVASVDRTEAARYGISVADVLNTIRTSTPGVLKQNLLTIHGEKIPYVVKFAGYEEHSASDLKSAMVAGPEGQTVRLAAVLSLSEQRTPGEILRENQSYVRWVTFEYRGPYRFGNAYVDATIRSMILPHGYRLERAASWFTFSDADKDSMLLIAGLALIIVFMITASLYESFTKPILVILAVPFSLIGMFLAFYLTGTPFGRGGYAAVMLLIGIVVTNSIVLVDFLSRHTGMHGLTADVLIDAATRRLRPILMTTLTTIGGLVPMLVFGDPSSVWFSLALGTIGGLTSSMCLTVLLVPVGYSVIHRRQTRFLNLKGSLRTMTL